MSGTVIYLHGALDAGLGFVTHECHADGAIAKACSSQGFALRNPIATGNPMPVAWHKSPLLDQIKAILSEGHGPYYLAGHSLGGRGALLTALRSLPGQFKAVGAIAPALGEGIDIAPISVLPTVADYRHVLSGDPYKPHDLKADLAASGLPAFIGFSSQDAVVILNPGDFAGINNPAARRVVKEYPYPSPFGFFPGAHNLLISRSAGDLMSFFKSIQ